LLEEEQQRYDHDLIDNSGNEDDEQIHSN
jgi:hypothetical protein